VANTDVMTTEDVAEYLQLNPETVRVWARQGRIPAAKVAGGHWRFLRDEVEEWLRSGCPARYPA
jgi:excisionase family DNA binding protein